MFPPPSGQTVNAEQIKDLDDTYFGNDIAGYFHSRVESLLSWDQQQTVDRSIGLANDVAKLVLAITESDAHVDIRGVHIAADAFAVRHHAAETLVRLVDAVLRARSISEERSVWQTIALGPQSAFEAVKNLRATLSAGRNDTLFSLISIPDAQMRSTAQDANLERAVEVMASWVEHAVYLLTRDDMHVNAGNNKAKHGMAIRASDDMRISFSKQGPNAHGRISATVLNGPDTVDIIDRPLLQLLAFPPRSVAPKQGLELTWLRLDAAILLAETTMIATTLGAIFHVAAKAHQDRYGTPTHIAPYPALRLGPTADELLNHSVTGMRFPVTDPPDGSANLRPPGVGFHDGFVPLTVDHAGASKAFVTDE
ncbi:MAG: hypothetical protein JWQ70_944 [Aeromicrobium sp.]|nr:hypothetical protein [Aeromicrobium sp.]